LNKHNSFILTTKSDQSLVFFAPKNSSIAYFEESDDALEAVLASKAFEVVYVRDPFNNGEYNLKNIETKLDILRKMQPNARYIDGISTLDDVLIEDKWRQYKLLGEYMSPTVLGSKASFIKGKHIAKKRISARSKDILFSVYEPLNNEWIVQDLISIDEELRVYAVNGKVILLATVKSSKTNNTKVKVVGVRTLNDAELTFAQKITDLLPALDFIGLDIAVNSDGLRLIEVNRSPQFKRYNELNKLNIIEKLFVDLGRDEMTLGIFENISFPELGVKNLLAKVDTGAYSGAIHCTDIKVIRRGKDKERILKFVPLGNKNLATEMDQFDETYVRSSTGHRIKRYVIATTVIVQGVTYETKMGLSDRSDMKRGALLGRRFLRENNLLVDVRKNSEFDDEGENTR